jgi:hypothetical protein
MSAISNLIRQLSSKKGGDISENSPAEWTAEESYHKEDGKFRARVVVRPLCVSGHLETNFITESGLKVGEWKRAESSIVSYGSFDPYTRSDEQNR